VTGHEHESSTERLWTPWRSSYVTSGTRESGCIFCNRLNRSTDVESLILHRARHSFVIMNLFPYNTGHIMLVPNQHAADPSELFPETLAEMGMMLPTLTNALRQAFSCHGFNVGLNIGATAGAGVEAHLHEHIVPRWQGDANFMPIIASTMTIPELIPVTYAKIRAELTRELTGATTAVMVLLDSRDNRVLLCNGALPTVDLQDGTPIVPEILSSVRDVVPDGQLVGWAGPDEASSPGGSDIALTVAGTLATSLPDGWDAVSYDGATDHATRVVIERAIGQRAPVQ
jgi:ATP adenylyltransferase